MEDDVQCPQCGGPMFAQGAASAALIDKSSSTSGVNAASAQKHARDIREKADTLGLIHKCAVCGYAMRYKPGAEPAGAEVRA